MKWIGLRVIAAMLALTAVNFLAGCGGGNDGGESSSAANPNPARASIAGQVLTLNGASTAREISFDPSGDLWIEDRDGVWHGGTYHYSPNGNSAELVLSESGVSATIRLTFSSSDSGAYTSEQDQGAFRLEAAPTDPNDPPSPGNPGGDEGVALASIDGLVLHGTRTFTSTGPTGQTHVYTFAGNAFHDSDPPEESDGTYTYSAAADRAVLTLNYTSPEAFKGDQHQLQMHFGTAQSGTFESVYRRGDGTMIQINGTFQFE